MADTEHQPSQPDAHRRYAEELLAAAQLAPESSSRRLDLLTEAGVHAQLALVEVVSYAATPQRLVVSSLAEGLSAEDIAEHVARQARRALFVSPSEVDAEHAEAVLTHPPVARPRRRSTQKKETTE